ncbi:DUF5666 domain-containing protein [Carboxydothermus hydrogenoformans]|uniref:DUF5666 domain-containing protein n=1 Tax=Carboxydothermus hydrogenoformans (strain ATCC BAA-161 / DSM 6008 / Z-2901) TaxID=246194 RepID=Q3ADQ5_CARHZ|nr:DUF5666 domain-containing protein [Carboxydothermus hydrogenoformans]ABB14890.1 hypothetical protein CHY_0879 [Carboxydothermus hydrogenoformans Z-2901]
MKKIAVLVLTVFLLGITLPALADTATTVPANTTPGVSDTVYANQTPTVSDTTYTTPSVTDQTYQPVPAPADNPLPFDLNLLNSLSYNQLKQLKEEIENLLEQKEEELQEFKGIVTSFDGQTLTVKGENEEKTFVITSDTDMEVKGELGAGYKAEVKYDPASNEAIKVEAKPVILEYTGTVISFDGNNLTVARGNGEQKTFSITENTKIEGLGKLKGEKTIKPGYKVGVKYTLTGNAIEVKVILAKVEKDKEKEKEKEKERKKESKKEKEQKSETKKFVKKTYYKKR